jgi:hypothetical protein
MLQVVGSQQHARDWLFDHQMHCVPGVHLKRHSPHVVVLCLCMSCVVSWFQLRLCDGLAWTLHGAALQLGSPH